MAEPTFEQLTEQVRRLTERVSVLERELGIRAAAATEPQPEISLAPIEPERTLPPKPVRDLEASVGLRLVNRVGAITLILGIAFFFRYAVENDWINETARVLLGAMAGMLFLAGGELAFRRGQRVFSQGITGAGAAALYLSVYAALGAYHLVSVSVAFLPIALTTALSGYLALRYNAQAIAVLALFGGFAAAQMLDGRSLGEWFIPCYLGVLDAGFVLLTSRRGWRVTEWVALLGTVIFTLEFAEAPLRVFLPIYYLLFATRPNPKLFAATHALLLMRAISLPPTMAAYPAQSIALSFGGLVVVRWRKWFAFSNLLVIAAAASWFLSSSSMKLPLPEALTTLTILFAMFFAASAWRADTAYESMNVSEVTGIPLTAAFYFGACYLRLTGWGDSWAALLALSLAGMYFALAYRLSRLPRLLPPSNLAGMASAAVAVSLFTLAIPIQFHAFRITVAWALEGAALVWIAAKRGVATARALGLVVLLCAAVRFAAVDLFMYPSPVGHTLLLNARFLTALSVAAAFFIAAIASRGTRVPTWAAGIAGHAILLTELAFEVRDWAAASHPQNYSGAASAGISILFAAYAVVLVALGTTQRSRGSRYMGLGSIAAVVVKLYLYDVWLLDPVYRFIAFAALGALLLTMSFLYSRFRDSVALWLRSEAVSTPGDASATHPPPPPV